MEDIEVDTRKYRSDRGECAILIGDVIDRLRDIPDQCVQTVVTSPPYFGLRDYGVDGQIGLEPTPEEFVETIVETFREVRRVLRDDGTVWLNLGDSYGDGKQLQGIPWRVAFALQQDGWYLRQDIIWHKPNPMPESVTDRCTNAHEHLFLLSKSKRYFYDHYAIRVESETEAGTAGDWDGNRDFNLPDGNTRFAKPNLGGSIDGQRNKRDVWTIKPAKFAEAHFATYPPELIKPCILAGTSEHGACSECGAPFEREVSKGDLISSGPNKMAQKPRSRNRMNPENEQPDEYGDLPRRERAFVGWQPTCDCDDPAPEPCLVLDPFAGSGTTGAVATDHGRGAFLIELNPEYAELAEKRVAEYEPEIKDLDFSENMTETLEAIANDGDGDHHWSTLRALRRRELIDGGNDLLVDRSEALGICRWYKENG